MSPGYPSGKIDLVAVVSIPDDGNRTMWMFAAIGVVATT